MKHRTAIFGLALVAFAAGARGDDVWVINGLAVVPAAGCTFLRWQADAVLHHLGSADAEVRLVDASNGAFAGIGTATVRAGSSVRLHDTALPFSPQALYVLHLDVPPAVAVEDRLDLFRDSCAPGQPPSPVPFTHLRLPVFRRLADAGERQVHAGADLGGQGVRMNVAVYNAAALPASAEISLIAPFCAERVLQTQQVVVAPNEIQQSPIVVPAVCAGAGSAVSKLVQVVSDQRGFSFVSVLSNDAQPTVTTAVVTGD